jgi:excisionase family DNA binding protein
MADIISTHFDLDSFREIIKEEIQKSLVDVHLPPKEDRCKMLDVEQVADYLGLKTSTIYSLTHTRKIPFYKPGKKLLFDPDEIEKWVRENRCSTSAEINLKHSKS